MNGGSALLCPFNSGTTTVTIRTGGLSFSQRVTVLAGSVQRPCGTRPIDRERFTTVTPVQEPVQTPEPPPDPPPDLPQPDIEVPVLPPAVVVPTAKPAPPAAVTRPPPVIPPPLDPPLPPGTPPPTGLPATTLPPPTAGFANPVPPSGATVRVIEEKREEEIAPESSQAFARVRAGERLPLGEITFAAVLLLALAGAAVASPRRNRQVQLAVAAAEYDPAAVRYRRSSFDDATGRRQR